MTNTVPPRLSRPPLRPSYYLDLKPLVDLTCQAIASLIKGKSPEEVRQTFNIPNDFDSEEESEVMRALEGQPHPGLHPAITGAIHSHTAALSAPHPA